MTSCVSLFCVDAGDLARAHVIALVEVTDPVHYEDYRKAVLPTIEQYGGRFIARGGRVDVLEGEWAPRRVVIVEFASMQQARAWWESDEYAGPKKVRQQHSRGTLIAVEGV